MTLRTTSTRRLGPALLTSLALALTAAASHARAAASNKQLTIGIGQEFESLNPTIAQMAASSYVHQMAVQRLVVIDSSWKYVCRLCKELPTLENGLAKIIDEGGKKKMLVTMEIKDKAQWGDGKPVTAQDVVFGWQVGMDSGVSVGSRETYDRVEAIDIDKTNPKKFTLKLKEARYDFFQLADFNVLPKHIEGPIFEKTKGKAGAYEKLTAYTTDPYNPGLYNGPYLLKEIKLGSHVIFERNPRFDGKRPAIEKVVIKLIQNTQALEANLLSGEVDMLCELSIMFDQALAFEKRIARDPAQAAKYKVLYEESISYEHIDLNLRNPMLQDKRVRQALLYAADRDKLTKALFEDKQKKALHMVHPKDIYFTADVAKYSYDPKKAGELLDQAGWKMGSGGVREKDGKKLSFVIMTTSQNKTRELVETFLQAEWKKVGIDLKIQNEPARVFFGETVRKGQYDAMAMFAWNGSPDNVPRTTLHSHEIPTAKNGYAGQNTNAWSSPRMDELIDAATREFDFDKRKAFFAEMQKLYAEEVPTIPLINRADVAILPSGMKGYQLTGHQFSVTNWAENWEIEANKTN